MEQKQNTGVSQRQFLCRNLRKMTLHNPNINRVSDIAYTQFGLNLSIRSQDMSETQIMTPIKGPKSVANLQKMTHPNFDLVNEKMYTKLVSTSQFLFVLKILKENRFVPE